MSDLKKQLVISFINFLKNESQNKDVDQDMAESLEVSIQCLETAYSINSSEDNGLNIVEIFNKAFQEQKSSTKKTESISEDTKVQADMLKTQGNNLVKAEKYTEAIESYTQAINLDPNNGVYYCNRAAVYTKLSEIGKALEDCEKAISIDPTYSKAYGRMGLLSLNGKNYEKAVQCYEKALSLEPTNQTYKSNLDLAREYLKAQRPQPANPLAGMDLGTLLNNPAVMNMAQSFMQNPQMQSMFANLMGGTPPPAGRVGSSEERLPASAAATEDVPDENTTAGATAGAGAGGGFQVPPGLDFSNIMNATQQFVSQMRAEDPELVESLRQQFQQGAPSNAPSNSTPSDQNPSPDSKS